MDVPTETLRNRDDNPNSTAPYPLKKQTWDLTLSVRLRGNR